jgi:hypothetical protein
MVSFTHHNIRLDDGTLTKPEIGFLLSESPWFLAAKRTIELAFQGDIAGKRLVDLGCLEGGYTVCTNGNGGRWYRDPQKQFRSVRIR